MSPQPPSSEDTLRLTLRGTERVIPRGGCVSTNVGNTYRDTPASELRSIIAEVEAGKPWRDAVAERYAQTNPWLHRIVTDPSRDLFFRMHPPPEGARILDLGAGWGQIALPLARRGRVCALEPTPERLEFIRAAAAQEGLIDNMWFVQADFFDVEFESRFDLVTCIGVLEWVPKFAPHLDPLEAQRLFLKHIRNVLAPGGQLVIGIENRLGLKYLLGAPDDHIGHPNIAVYDFRLADQMWQRLSGQPLRAVVHSRVELSDLLRDAGFGALLLHCAFPDYKLPGRILAWGAPTNQFLASGFVGEHDGTTGRMLPFQAELESHYRSLSALGIVSDFAPSFMVCATEAP